jgi:uncharacterized protein (TIGR03066 family)
MNRCWLLLILLVAFLPGGGCSKEKAVTAEPPIDKEKLLVGEWRFEDEQQHVLVSYVFRPNGTFASELRQNGEQVRKLEGLWTLEGDLLVYTYTKDSLGQGDGLKERDRLLRIDDSSYTIESGDKAQRTYFRVKS